MRSTKMHAPFGEIGTLRDRTTHAGATLFRYGKRKEKRSGYRRFDGVVCSVWALYGWISAFAFFDIFSLHLFYQPWYAPSDNEFVTVLDWFYLARSGVILKHPSFQLMGVLLLALVVECNPS